jgi:hypothetical protein
MIDEHLVTGDLRRGQRSQEEPVGNLDVRLGDAPFHPPQRARVVHVPALDGDDLALADPSTRE